MRKRNRIIAGLLCLTILFFMNHSVTMFKERRGEGLSIVAPTQEPEKVIVKQGTIAKSLHSGAQTPIRVAAQQSPTINGSVKFPIKTQTFDIGRHNHKVWGNKEMSEYILGKRYEEFKKNTTTDKLVQEVKPLRFRFLINNDTLCRSHEKLEFLMAVYTAPKHIDDRIAIRKTWGRQNLLAGHTSRTVFLIGKVVDPELQKRILEESKIYGDIVQANYIDSYHNLSSKGVSLLQWIKEHCNNAQYLVKADDDLYVDVFQVVKAIQALVPIPRFIIGKPLPSSPIVRWGRSKWIVKKHLFPRDQYYPPYYQGWIYILPNAVFLDFYKAAMATPVFHIDDVYMTGLLAGQLSNFDFLSFEGKAPNGTFMPTHPRLAIDPIQGAEYKVTLFCKQLMLLTSSDKNLIAKSELEIIKKELECEGDKKRDKRKNKRKNKRKSQQTKGIANK